VILPPIVFPALHQGEAEVELADPSVDLY
jgi:hypothetical protein